MSEKDVFVYFYFLNDLTGHCHICLSFLNQAGVKLLPQISSVSFFPLYNAARHLLCDHRYNYPRLQKSLHFFIPSIYCFSYIIYRLSSFWKPILGRTNRHPLFKYFQSNWVKSHSCLFKFTALGAL